MLHDYAIFDMLVPGALIVFLSSILLQLALDGALGRSGFYRHVWHPPLFRLASFFCIFSLTSLWLLKV